ncbi:MAG: tyrosine--tRNA ligase [bacterium]
MGNVFDVLRDRGFVQQVTDEDAVRQHLSGGRVTCYVGFDPTADSLHAGSLMPIMALAHMQRWGHRPIAIIGGGTAMVGDPSGRTEMRRVLAREEISANAERIRVQLGRYLDLRDGSALILDNADWLLELNYIDFLRDIGRHFSVNRMLSAEAYRIRMETGLSFLEFNYQLLQAYDFLTLYRRYGCTLQMGGDDQWGNILAGVDLVRRVEGAVVHCITFPLLTTAGGEKMGKTARGAVWLDPSKTSPYEFYQYWVNVDDRDVERFLAYFTFLPVGEIRRVREMEGAELNLAKSVLAYEATKITHGEGEARKAWEASAGAFGVRSVPEGFFPSSSIPRGVKEDISKVPTTAIPRSRLGEGVKFVDLLVEVGLVASKGEARRLIKQGGAYVNGEGVEDVGAVLRAEDFVDGSLILRAGKKRHHRVILE